jgi:hypothetical protein
MSLSAFIIFDIISSQRFLSFDIMPCLAFITFNIISSRLFSLFDILSRSAFITFVLTAFRHHLPFDVLCFRRFLLFNIFSTDLLSHSMFCPLTFFTVGVFYFDILSVNQDVEDTFSYYFWRWEGRISEQQEDPQLCESSF